MRPGALDALGIGHAKPGEEVAIADPVRVHRLAHGVTEIVGRVHQSNAARHDLHASRGVRVGQHQRTARRRIDRARIGRAQVGTGRQLQAPAGGALRQHRRQRPVGALELARLRPQVDRLVVGQLDLGHGRNQGAARQRQHAAGRHRRGQGHALGQVSAAASVSARSTVPAPSFMPGASVTSAVGTVPARQATEPSPWYTSAPSTTPPAAHSCRPAPPPPARRCPWAR